MTNWPLALMEYALAAIVFETNSCRFNGAARQCGWFVRGVGAAQQPQRAAPHTGVPEIGATLCGCYAGAVGGAQGQLNTACQTSTGAEPIAMAGIVLGTCICM